MSVILRGQGTRGLRPISPENESRAALAQLIGRKGLGFQREFAGSRAKQREGRRESVEARQEYRGGPLDESRWKI